MNNCYECGSKLELKELKNEGFIPFCPNCKTFRFPIFNTAISAVIVNKDITKTLLIRQYNMGFDVLVAGYINKGENAESALDVMRSLVSSGAIDGAIVNSVAGLSPKVEIEEDLEKQRG